MARRRVVTFFVLKHPQKKFGLLEGPLEKTAKQLEITAFWPIFRTIGLPRWDPPGTSRRLFTLFFRGYDLGYSPTTRRRKKM